MNCDDFERVELAGIYQQNDSKTGLPFGRWSKQL
jgi:hypothetical protein